MHKVNIRDVALEAGVSVTTVSKALNNYPDVSEETRKRIMEIADRLNYVADVSAKRMGSKESPITIALLMGALEPADPSGFVYSILSGVYYTCQQYHCEFILLVTPREEQTKTPLLKLCREKGVSGLVAAGLKINDPYVDQIQKLSLPVAVIDMQLKGPNLKCIAVDNVSAAEQAVTFLLEKGHREIAMINGKKEAAVSHMRYRGYRKALEHYHLRLNKNYIQYGDFQREKAQEATCRLLDASPSITAIFAASDLMAFGVCQALEDRGLKPGIDIDVVGFDDIPLSSYLYGGVTTIHQDPYYMGRAAGEAVYSMLKPEVHISSDAPAFALKVRNTARITETKTK